MRKTPCTTTNGLAFRLALVLAIAAGAPALAQVAAPAPEDPTPAPGDAKVLLDCQADAEGKVSDCKVLSELPAGENFGAVALSMIQISPIRQKPQTPGGRVVVPLTFRGQAHHGEALNPRRLAPSVTPVVPANAGPGESIAAFPYAFKRTGVLTADVTGYSLSARGVLAPAGSVGFFAGSFSSRTSEPSEVWCFFPPADAARKTPLCLRLLPKLAQILPSVDPFDIGAFPSGNLNYANLPRFEEKAVEIPGDLRMDYRFGGWKGEQADIEVWTNGRKSRTETRRKEPDGAIHVYTLAGEYRLTPMAENPARALVTAVAP